MLQEVLPKLIENAPPYIILAGLILQLRKESSKQREDDKLQFSKALDVIEANTSSSVSLEKTVESLEKMLTKSIDMMSSSLFDASASMGKVSEVITHCHDKIMIEDRVRNEVRTR